MTGFFCVDVSMFVCVCVCVCACGCVCMCVCLYAGVSLCMSTPKPLKNYIVV